MMFAHLTEASAQAGVGAPVEVTVDYTVGIQIGIFVVLMLVLKPLLFDPMMKLFSEREKRIEGAKLAARKIDEKSGAALTTYETEMAKARASANAERDKLRAEGVSAENEILTKVRAATAKAVDEGKKKAQDEASKVRATLRADSAQIAKELASRVLGREVQG